MTMTDAQYDRFTRLYYRNHDRAKIETASDWQAWVDAHTQGKVMPDGWAKWKEPKP